MSQPTPPGRRSFWQWYRAQTRFARIGLGCASLFVVLMLCTGALAAYGSTLPLPPKTAQSPTSLPTKAPTRAIVLATVPTTPPTPSPTASRVPTATPTMKPTPTPTTVPGNLAPTYGTPRLGGPITDFIGKYGKPDTGCATCASGIYNFQRYQGTGIDYISTMLTDANGHPYAFDVQAPPNSDWDASGFEQLSLLRSDLALQQSRCATRGCVGTSRLVGRPALACTTCSRGLSKATGNEKDMLSRRRWNTGHG